MDAPPVNAAERTVSELELCREAKVVDLLGDARNDRFEASGVVAVGDRLYVIFDNTPQIGRVDRALSPGDDQNCLMSQRFSDDVGYEDIAYDRWSRRLFILIESLPHEHGFMAKVREYDTRFEYVATAWLPFPLPGPNKGLEGLTCVHRAGQTYLLAVCEGNLCLEGAAGRQPGGGRIQVFGRSAQGWDLVATIALPTSLWFEDFSSLALAGDRLCVVSQESSALWVGRLARSAWRVLDEGAVYRFPRDDDAKVVYCNVEGVAWVSAAQVVVASDKAKPGRHEARCRSKDQSIHLFAIPQGAGLEGRDW